MVEPQRHHPVCLRRDSSRQPLGMRFFNAMHVMLERSRRLRRVQPLLGRRSVGRAIPPVLQLAGFVC